MLSSVNSGRYLSKSRTYLMLYCNFNESAISSEFLSKISRMIFLFISNLKISLGKIQSEYSFEFIYEVSSVAQKLTLGLFMIKLYYQLYYHIFCYSLHYNYSDDKQENVLLGCLQKFPVKDIFPLFSMFCNIYHIHIHF